jgi:hypothetical protein
MKPVRINFAASGGPWVWSFKRLSVRILLVCLCCSALLGAVVMLRARQMESELTRAQDALSQLDNLRQKETLRFNAVSRQTPEEETVLRLAGTLRELPWEAIFQAVESTQAQVRLQSFEPDLARGVVKLQGRADDLAVMQAYVRELEALPVFRRVVLQRHAVPSGEGASGIDFACEAILETGYRLPEVKEAQQ